MKKKKRKSRHKKKRKNEVVNVETTQKKINNDKTLPYYAGGKRISIKTLKEKNLLERYSNMLPTRCEITEDFRTLVFGNINSILKDTRDEMLLPITDKQMKIWGLKEKDLDNYTIREFETKENLYNYEIREFK